MTPRYTAAYCEENVWWLAHDRADAADEVVLISNAQRTVAMRGQRAGKEGAPVVWDYHVVLASRGEIWDLDCTIGMPLTTAAWIDASFPSALPMSLAPRFRVVPAADFVAQFASDRRHMRDANGAWLAPPPPWPAIGTGHDLDRWVDTRQGSWIDVAMLRSR